MNITPAITIVGDPHPPVRRVDESLQRYRTIAFGVELMESSISRSYVEPGQVNAALWWSMIPACYRKHVMPCVERVLGKHRRSKLTESTLHAFVFDLNRDIWQHVEPIMPDGIGMHDDADEADLGGEG